MWQRYALRAAGSTKHVAAIPAMMFPVCEGELLPTPHADIAVRPLGWCVGVEHTACHLLPRREVEAFVL